MVAVAQPQSVLTVPGPRPRPVIGGLLNSIKFAKDSVGYTRELFSGIWPSGCPGKRAAATRLYSPRESCSWHSLCLRTRAGASGRYPA